MAPLSPLARLRLAYYLLFTMVGVFHAEVLSRSQPWGLVNPPTVAILFAVYGLHYVVLGDLLLRRRLTGLAPVFLCGCLLGLYEFVVTKVYWVPYWNPTSGAGVGFAWFEVLWVGFAWHAVMSFTIPFMLMRWVFLPGSKDPWQSRNFRAVLFGVPLLTAGFSLAMGDSPVVTGLSIGASLGEIALFSYFFSRRAPVWGYTGPDDLVLSRRALQFAAAALVVVYVVLGATLRLEALPAGPAILAPLPFYALVLALLYPYLKRTRVQEGAETAPPAPEAPAPPHDGPASAPPPVAAAAEATTPWSGARSFLVRYAGLFGVFIALSSLLVATVPWVLFILVIVMVYGGTLGGAVLLGWSAVSSWKVWRQAQAA